MPLLYLNIETTGLNPIESELTVMCLMTQSGKQVAIKNPEVLKTLKSKLENNTIVGYNLKPDLKYLKHKHGIILKNIYDAYTAELIISNGKTAGLMYQDIVMRYCGTVLKTTGEPEEYMLNALKYLPEIMQQQQAKIKLLGLSGVIDKEMREIPAVVEFELSNVGDLKKKLPFDEMIMRDNTDMQGLETLLEKVQVLLHNHPELRQKAVKDVVWGIGQWHPDFDREYTKQEIEEAIKQCREDGSTTSCTCKASGKGESQTLHKTENQQKKSDIRQDLCKFAGENYPCVVEDISQFAEDFLQSYPVYSHIPPNLIRGVAAYLNKIGWKSEKVTSI